MNILVTGGTGFVGKILVNTLVKKHKVTCISRNKPKIGVKGVTYLTIDIKKPFVLGKYDYVYHLVGVGNLSAVSQKEFNNFYRTNVLGTKNLLDAIITSGAKPKKIICLSSTAAVGLYTTIINESATPRPKSPYQKSKFEMEKLITEYMKKLPLVILRPSMVYGPGSKNSELITMARFIKNGFFPLFNSGANIVPIVHVEDLSQSIINAALKAPKGNIYFITNEKLSSMRCLIDYISLSLGKKPFIVRFPKNVTKIILTPFEYVAKRLKIKIPITRDRIDSMTANRVFCVEKAKHDFGFTQNVPVQEGVIATIQWYKNNGII